MRGSQVKPSQSKPPGTASKKTSWKDRVSQDDYEELKATFECFERQDGTIDPEQINSILKQLGLQGRQSIVNQMIEGFISMNRPMKFDEFLEIVASKAGDCKSKDGLERVFQLWDHENTGEITLKQFKKVAKELGETMNDDEITEMMHNAYILNGSESNQSFTFEEFYSIICKK